MRMEDDTRLYVKPRYDYVQREIYLHRGCYIYEAHLVNWIIQNLKAGMTMVDIGAHIGYYLGPVCRSIGPNGKAIFIEPLPEHYMLLQKSIAINKFSWANSLNAAISNQSGDVVFYPAKDSGRNSLAKNAITDAQPIRVPAISLDQMCSDLGLATIDLLQMDIEGAEVLVVRGGSECLNEHRIKTILCEWHPQQLLNDFQTDPLEFLGQIAQHGFDVFRLDPQTGKEHAFNSGLIHAYQHLVFRLP